MPRAALAPEHATKRTTKLRKASTASECLALEQLPNIGVSLAADLRSIGIREPRDLIGRDPLALYQALSQRTGQRQDPCVLDTFMAATAFMQGAGAAPWWHFTARRKALYGQLEAAPASVSKPMPKPMPPA